jgi:hypothetical protein
MGRLTPSFRVVYGEVLQELRREIRDSYIDLQHKRGDPKKPRWEILRYRPF